MYDFRAPNKIELIIYIIIMSSLILILKLMKL